ncbi:MAG: acetate--CoA ligase family protein, partial [Arenicella sp.]|nr:acetate--CoA ligase family protein [Arenicella sp.]
ILLAPMIKDGVETILGVHRDPVFGPMIMFGCGGVMVELFKDVSFASAPVTPARAQRLIDSTQGSKLLSGWRGDTPKDRAALVDAICCLSDLVIAADNIEGVDINPFVVRENGAVALDAVVTTRNKTSDL